MNLAILSSYVSTNFKMFICLLINDSVVGKLTTKHFFYLLYLSSIHEKAIYRYVLDGKSALARELPFSGHLSST